MAKIYYAKNSQYGAMVAAAISQITSARNLIARALAQANSVTNNGAVPANLEGATVTDWDVNPGQGATFYANLETIETALAGIVPLADMDQGV